MSALQFFFIRYWAELWVSGPISLGLTALLALLLIATFVATCLKMTDLAGRLLQFAFAVVLLDLAFMIASVFPWKLDSASVWRDAPKDAMDYYRNEIHRTTASVFSTWSVGIGLLIPTLALRAVRSDVGRNRSREVLRLIGIALFFVLFELLRFNLRVTRYYPEDYRNAFVPRSQTSSLNFDRKSSREPAQIKD